MISPPCHLYLSSSGNIGDISEPITLTTYKAVADFVSPKDVTPVFSFKKGSLLQVVQKDQSGMDHDMYRKVFHGIHMYMYMQYIYIY